MPASINSKRRLSLSRWAALLHQRFPSLSGTQSTGLALWSIGVVLAYSASLHAVVLALACWLPFNPLSLRKRLQEWYLEASAKKGHGCHGKGFQRKDFDPHAASRDLFRWILDDWPNNQLVLALDPTNFGDRFTVLNISVLYRGCAVPVIWTVVEGGKPEAWEPHWEHMLRTLADSVPGGWQVLVLTDRGMYSPSLFRCLVQLHWHPFLRIRAQGFYRPLGSQKWLELKDLHPSGDGRTEAFAAEVFKNDAGRLQCTLAVYHSAGHAEPWLIVTDVTPEVAQATWYGLRGWIEQGYKRVKSEGWYLQRTRITNPKRLERLWLAVAVATMWVLEVGGEAEQTDQNQSEKTAPPSASKKVGQDIPELPDLEQPSASGEATTGGAKTETSKQEVKAGQRKWAVFARGWNIVRNALAVGLVLLGSWHPEAWPDHPRGGLAPTPADCTQGCAAEQSAAFCSISNAHVCDSS
jgi:Transposase DDE domain